MIFIVFEGPDGSGKTVQLDLVHRFLLSVDGHPPVMDLRDPGSTVIGERLRRELRDAELPLGPRTQLMGFLTARVAMMEAHVQGSDPDTVFLCDRFDLSTLVYQSTTYPGGLAAVHHLSDTVMQGFKPDLYVVLAASDEELARRLSARESKEGSTGRDVSQDRYQGASPAYVAEWRAAYRDAARLLPGRDVAVVMQQPGETLAQVANKYIHAVASKTWLRGLPWVGWWNRFLAEL